MSKVIYKEDLFVKAKRVADYDKLKRLHLSILSMIEKIEEEIRIQTRPRNPREDVQQTCNKNSLRVLYRQRSNSEQKMALLEETIKKDMEEFEIYGKE